MPLHYDGRAARAAVKAETRMASDVVLPPGTGGETADCGRFPCAGTTGNPDQDHRWRRLLSCSSGMRLPPRGVPVVPRRGDGWPAREHLTGWRGETRPARCSLRSIRQAEAYRYEYIANGGRPCVTAYSDSASIALRRNGAEGYALGPSERLIRDVICDRIRWPI
jgi:hypothetical protein